MTVIEWGKEALVIEQKNQWDHDGNTQQLIEIKRKTCSWVLFSILALISGVVFNLN